MHSRLPLGIASGALIGTPRIPIPAVATAPLRPQVLLVLGWGFGTNADRASHTACQAQWAKKMAYLQECKVLTHRQDGIGWDRVGGTKSVHVSS